MLDDVTLVPTKSGPTTGAVLDAVTKPAAPSVPGPAIVVGNKGRTELDTLELIVEPIKSGPTTGAVLDVVMRVAALRDVEVAVPFSVVKGRIESVERELELLDTRTGSGPW